MVLPKEHHAAALAEAHDQPQAGHLGVDKTYHRLATRYYWLGFYHNIAQYVRVCDICQRCKVEQAFNTAYHSSLKTSPSFLNFGRDPLPQGTLHEKLEPVTSEPPRPGNVDTWSERVKRLEALRDLMKRHLDAANNKQADAYNLRVRPRTYQNGDRVLRRDRTLSSASK